tara:strand:+ start:238 stop:351 length:114 start_codon:yes stop_codon:yes gene_type:complete
MKIQPLFFRALFDLLGAVIIVGVGVILMLAYFDVLTK